MMLLGATAIASAQNAARVVLRNAEWPRPWNLPPPSETLPDHVLLEPGKAVVFPPRRCLGDSLFRNETAAIRFLTPGDQQLLFPIALEAARLPLALRILIPEVPPGTYERDTRLALPDPAGD
jgi:hypothetical protein